MSEGIKLLISPLLDLRFGDIDHVGYIRSMKATVRFGLVSACDPSVQFGSHVSVSSTASVFTLPFFTACTVWSGSREFSLNRSLLLSQHNGSRAVHPSFIRPMISIDIYYIFIFRFLAEPAPRPPLEDGDAYMDS